MHQDPIPDTSPAVTPDQAPVVPHADPLPPPVRPSATPAAGAQDRPITKRSLFNVFSWSNNKETSVAEVKVEIDFVPDAPHTVHVCTVSSENETIQQGDPRGAVVGFTPRSDPLPLPGGSIPQPMSNTSGCGEPPVSQSPPSPLPRRSPTCQVQEGTSSASAASSATSIFAINFPLLAKSSPQPNTAVTPSPQEPSACLAGKSSTATTGMGAVLMSQNVLDFLTDAG